MIMFNSFVNTLKERLGRDVDVVTYASLENSPVGETVKDEVVLYEQQG